LAEYNWQDLAEYGWQNLAEYYSWQNTAEYGKNTAMWRVLAPSQLDCVIYI